MGQSAIQYSITPQSEKIISYFLKRASNFLYLISFPDIIVAAIFSKSHRGILCHRVVARYGMTPTSWRFTRHFLDNLYQEIKKKRIATSINRRFIRRIFWANMRFSKTMRIALADASSATEPSISLWRHTIEEAHLSIDLEPNTRPGIEEGDFRLILCYENVMIHSITFSLHPGKPFNLGLHDIIIVGGNQGCPPEFWPLRTRAAREYHEILAGDVLMLALIGIAQAISSPFILGVSIENHSRKYFYPTFPNDTEMHGLYDTFWQSYDATTTSHFYHIRTDYNPTEKKPPNGRNKGRKLRKREIKNDLIQATAASFLQVLQIQR